MRLIENGNFPIGIHKPLHFAPLPPVARFALFTFGGQKNRDLFQFGLGSLLSLTAWLLLHRFAGFFLKRLHTTFEVLKLKGLQFCLFKLILAGNVAT